MTGKMFGNPEEVLGLRKSGSMPSSSDSDHKAHLKPTRKMRVENDRIGS